MLFSGRSFSAVYGDARTASTCARPDRVEYNTIDGGAGSDLIFGGTKNDTIDGGSEGDTIFVGTALSTIHGGAGNDLILISDLNVASVPGSRIDSIDGGS